MSTSALTTLFQFNGMAMGRNLDGITHEESLRSPEEGGNSLNWVLGHLVLTRNTVHRLLGLPPAWEADDAQREMYRRGSHHFAAAAAVPLDTLRSAYQGSQEAVLGALGGISAEALAQPVADRAAPTGDGTLAGALVGLGFHEAYHVGQIGLLRRIAGKPGAIS